jgi:hypothetical protein
MDLDVRFDIDSNTAMLGGSSLVFHCHHYNAQLQKTIEEGLGDAAHELLAVAGQEAARFQLQKIAGETRGKDVLTTAAELFRRAGFGTLQAEALTAQGGHVICPSSHYALGWLAKFGERDRPSCQFVSGYVAASVIAAWGYVPERVRVVESACQAMGDAHCRFDVEVR